MPPSRMTGSLWDALHDTPVSLATVPSDFGPHAIAKSLALLEVKYRDIRPAAPPQFDPDVACRAILEEYQHRGNLLGLRPRLLRQAPWVYFIQFRGEPALAENRALVGALVEALKHRYRPRDVASLLQRYLLYFPTGWGSWNPLRLGIGELLRQDSPRLDGWRSRSVEYHLLSERAASEFAKTALSRSGSIADVLRRAGLEDELAKGRFVEEAYRGMLEHLRKCLSGASECTDMLNKVLAFSETRTELRFDALRGDLANALLEPFESVEPTAAIRIEIERFMTRNYRHPGLYPARWLGASEAARGVMQRWLVGTTLEDFFHVLDRTASATSAEGSRWRYRKAFWGAYYRAGLIRDAWVAVSGNARRFLWQRRRDETVKYAELLGGTPNDCLLLMKIAGLTIAEWSHTGMCRFWAQNSQTAPKLYRSRYDKTEVQRSRPNEMFRHDSSAAYGWQERLSDYIRTRTGATVGPGDYRLG